MQFGVNTNVGRPDEVDYSYSGPAGQGFDFAPGFDLNNYRTVTFATFPTANVMLADGVQSPLTREFTAGIGREIGQRAARASDLRLAERRRGSSRTSSTCRAGITNIPLVGPVTNRVYDNVDGLDRDYQALIVQSGYRVRDNLRVDGHYTVQLRNEGNFAGEAANQPGHSVDLRQLPGNLRACARPPDAGRPPGQLPAPQAARLTAMYNAVARPVRLGGPGAAVAREFRRRLQPDGQHCAPGRPARAQPGLSDRRHQRGDA